MLTRPSNHTEQKPSTPPVRSTRICPWWMGHILVHALRALFQNPKALLGEHVRAGMKVLDLGCAMGFFSLPLAKMVGPQGRILCLDVQERMIARLLARALRAGLAERVDARVCTASDLGADDWAGSVDLAAAFYVVHEVPHIPALLEQVHGLLRPGGRLLLVEPKGHVSPASYAETLVHARTAGFREVSRPRIRFSYADLLEK